MDGISEPLARVRRKKAPFRQKDLQRAIKAVQDAGLHVSRVEVDQAGKLVIVTGADEPARVPNPWDMAHHDD